MKLLRVRMMKPYLCLMGGGSGVFCEQVIQGGAGGRGSRISRSSDRCDDPDIPPPTPPAAGSAGTGGRSAGNKRIKLIKPNGVVALYERPIRASKLMEEYPKHRVCRSDSFYIGQKIPHLSDQDKLQKGHTYFLLPSHLFHSVLSFVTIASFASQPLPPPQPSTSTTQPPPPAPSVLGAVDSNISDCSVTASLRIKREEEEQQMKSRAALLKKAAGAGRMSSSSPPAFDIQKTKSGTLRIRVSEVFISQLIMDQQRDYEKEEVAELEEEEEKEEKKKRLLCTTPQLHKDYKQLVMGSRVRHWKPKLDMISETSTTTININAPNKQKRKALLSSASFGIRKNKKSSSSTTTTDGSCKITDKTCKKSSSSRSNQTSSSADDSANEQQQQQKQQPQLIIDHGKSDESDDHDHKELVQVVPSSKPSSTAKVPPTACKCKLRRFKLKLGRLTTTTTSSGTSRSSSPAIVIASPDRAVQKIVV